MEFALSIIFVILFLIGIFELLLLIYSYNVIADAAKEGVRYAVVHGSLNGRPTGPTSGTTCTAVTCPDIAGPPAPPGTVPGYGSGYGVVKTYAQYSFHDTSRMNITVTYPDSAPRNQAPNRVQIQVSYRYQPFFGLGWPTVTLNAAAEGRITY